jgi:hypothetical protein
MAIDQPLADLDEQTAFDGITTWFAEAPRGSFAWVITWFPTTGNIAAWQAGTKGRTGYRATAADLGTARAEAQRIADLIAAGKKA